MSTEPRIGPLNFLVSVIKQDKSFDLKVIFKILV